jgi:hypothetical protein
VVNLFFPKRKQQFVGNQAHCIQPNHQQMIFQDHLKKKFEHACLSSEEPQVRKKKKKT